MSIPVSLEAAPFLAALTLPLSATDVALSTSKLMGLSPLAPGYNANGFEYSVRIITDVGGYQDR
jgi:hypothetical protein